MRIYERFLGVVWAAIVFSAALAVVPGAISRDAIADHQSAAQRISNGTATEDRYPSAAIGPAGELYVSFGRSGVATDDILVRADSDGYAMDGVPQFNTTVVANDVAGRASASDREAPLVVDPSGSVYVAWTDDRTGSWDIRVARSDDDARSFLASRGVSDMAATADVEHSPAMAMGRTGTIYIAWADDRNNPGSGNHSIFFSKSVDRGMTWSTSVRVNDVVAGTSHGYPAVAVDSAERIFVAWTQIAPSPKAYLDSSTNGGASWGADRSLSTALGSEHPDVTIGVRDIVHVTWVDNRSGDSGVYFARSFDHGTTFLPSMRLNDPGATGVVQPRISATRNEFVYIQWIENGAPDILHLVYLYESGSWEWWHRWLSFSAYEGTMAVDASNSVLSVWSQDDGLVGGGLEVYGFFIDQDPSAPTGFNAVRGASPGTVVLSWAPALEVDVGSYLIYRETQYDWTLLTGLPAGATSFVDPGRPDGEWIYHISAVDRQGHRGDDATAIVTTGVTTDDRLVQLQGEVDTLQSEIDTLQADVSGLEGQNNALQGNLTNANREIGDLQSQLGTAQNLTLALLVVVIALTALGLLWGRKRRPSGWEAASQPPSELPQEKP